MTRSILLLAILLLTGVPGAAQWLNYPTPDLPRTADGKPNLAAPVPRTADGRPDLSGHWRLDGLGYVFNIFGDQKVDMLPWAQEVYAKRSIGFAKDSPDSNCLPPGPFVCNENEKSSQRYTGDASTDNARAVSLPPAVLSRYAGSYNAGPLGILRVVNEGGSLALMLPTGGARHAIVATSADDLFVPDLGSPIRFLRGAGGDVTHLRLTIVEGDIDAPRLPAR